MDRPNSWHKRWLCLTALWWSKLRGMAGAGHLGQGEQLIWLLHPITPTDTPPSPCLSIKANYPKLIILVSDSRKMRHQCPMVADWSGTVHATKEQHQGWGFVWLFLNQNPTKHQGEEELSELMFQMITFRGAV